MFLFGVGYGVGPQFVRGIAKDGLPQALFSVVQCILCLAAPYRAAKLTGYGGPLSTFPGYATIPPGMRRTPHSCNKGPPGCYLSSKQDPAWGLIRHGAIIAPG